MGAVTYGIGATLSYLISSIFQGINLTSRRRSHHTLILLFSFLAITAHGLHLYEIIFTEYGVNLGFFKVASLLSWLVAVIVLLSSLKTPVDNLFVVVFPIALVAIGFSMLFSGSYQPQQTIAKGVAVHIIFSVLAYAVLSIAAVQALLLAFQNRQLKQHHARSILPTLPSLETMEQLLFVLLWIGILLLSAAIVSGFWFLENMFAQHVVHKTVLTICSWWVFAILLWGRYQWGWRGATAIRWTLVGILVLMLAFLGSKIVLELVLKQPV